MNLSALSKEQQKLLINHEDSQQRRAGPAEHPHQRVHGGIMVFPAGKGENGGLRQNQRDERGRQIDGLDGVKQRGAVLSVGNHSV